MRGILRWLRTRAGAEHGFTLVEMFVATSLSLVVIGSSTAVMTTGLRSEPRLADRSADVQAARATMERLTQEIRQGTTVNSATATQLSFVTYVNSATCGGASSTVARQCRVTYSCASGRCTRTERNPDGTGSTPAVEVVSGLTSSSIFTYSPSATAPGFIGVQLVLPAVGGDDAITLTDGVTLRNATGGAS